MVPFIGHGTLLARSPVETCPCIRQVEMQRVSGKLYPCEISPSRIKSKNTNKAHRQNQHNSCNFFPKSERPHVSPDVHDRCIVKEVRLGDVGRTVVKEVEGAPADMTAAPTAWPNRG